MISAISLFSGGLDSILASRLIAAQGVRVVAVKFVSPFFEYGLLARNEEYVVEVCEKYGIEVVLRDISKEYIELLKAPAHGYGKHFNPCIDCKIFMISRAKEMLAEYDASFLITGEVIGQRPMSQRRDALRVIERDSGCDFIADGSGDDTSKGSLLLRPLCAKNLSPTRAENEGWVNRDLLYDFSGRGRNNQISLAKELGITDYPSPAGGCILTDPVIGERIKKAYQISGDITVADMCLIQIGRQMRMPDGSWLVMGRKESENQTIEGLCNPADILLKLIDRPGPTAILRNMSSRNDLELAAGLVARYGKKDNNGNPMPGDVLCCGEVEEQLRGNPPDDNLRKSLMW